MSNSDSKVEQALELLGFFLFDKIYLTPLTAIVVSKNDLFIKYSANLPIPIKAHFRSTNYISEQNQPMISEP
ncbi:hypothetical protein HZH66_014654 [Vespula vulgaris]|uniref:Uncharacterized protein n=1 Tax=Vespula vulgaris TaxID=7454 RepID=A0A834MQV6_VESVU|nr:hypothetical protein HZH66_014654 [Vespula vulgaris]